MGNEMGNNNTSAIKEEDNISEAERKTCLEDTSELANGILQNVHADIVKKENHNIPTFIAKDVQEKASEASNDLQTELEKDTWQDDGHADDVKGKNQGISTAAAKDGEEKAIASNHTTGMLETDAFERDTHASDVNKENQMHPTTDAEDVQIKATGEACEDITTEFQKVTLQEDSHADDVKEKIQMIPAAEAKDVQEKATELISDNTANMLENDSSEGESCESDANKENQVRPTVDAEDVQEKAMGVASDCTRSSLENDVLKGNSHEDDVNVDHQKHQTEEGKDDQIAARLGFDDKTSEFEDKPQEDKQDGNVVIPIANNTDVQGKISISTSDDPVNLINYVGGAGDEIMDFGQHEKSPNAKLVEFVGENSESLAISSLEGTEDYAKQEESCLGKHLLVTCDHPINNEPSTKQDKEEITTLNVENMSTDSEVQESSTIHSNHDAPVKSLSKQSLQGTESFLKDTNSHFQQSKDDASEKEMEFHEKMLCADKSDGRDGNEFECDLMDTYRTAYDSLGINNSNNGNILTEVNYTAEDSLDLLLESSVMDNQLKFHHEENCNVLHEERKLSRSGSTTENSYIYKADQAMKDSLNEYKSCAVNMYDRVEPNGDSNEERSMVLDSSASGIANSDPVQEPKVTENGLKFDANVNRSNKASAESSDASEQKHSVVPEAKTGFLIARLTEVDCRLDKEENYNNETEETNENPEDSYAIVKTFEETEESEQCNSELETIIGEESFTLQNSTSLLHVYNCHQSNVNEAKSFIATTIPISSDWKQTNDSNYFVATVDNIDFSKLTVTSLDLVDDAAFQKEGEVELTTSEATMSIEPFSNNSEFGNGGYEARDSITRLSIESNPDNAIISCQIQKSPSFKLNLQIQARPTESDQTPLLNQNMSANESLSNSMPHAEHDHCLLPREEMAVEEKIVTMERSYSESEKSKGPFLGLLKEEAHLLVMPQTQDNHADTKKEVEEVSSISSTKGKEKRKPRSSFFSSCIMCCATVAN